MDLLLKPDERRVMEAFGGDLSRLHLGVASTIGRLEQILLEYDKPPQLALLVGHPGTGKSSLMQALHALNLPEAVGMFQVDQYIDWGKVVSYVNQQPEMDSSFYVPVANRAALTLSKELFADKKLIIIDGGGLLRDYSEICRELGFTTPASIVLDAPEDVLRARLQKRGDGFQITEKETREHKQNLSDYPKYGGICLSTANTDKDNPSQELATIINHLCEVLRTRAW